jgi:hypothetical protein
MNGLAIIMDESAIMMNGSAIIMNGINCIMNDIQYFIKKSSPPDRGLPCSMSGGLLAFGYLRFVF